MPYVECLRCGLSAFSAAYRFDVERCARCGATLPRPRSAIDRAKAPLAFSREGRAPRDASSRGVTSAG